MTKLQKEHFEILLESMDSKIDLLLEALGATTQKIDNRVAELKYELKEDISVLDCKITGLSKRVDSAEERLFSEIAEVKVGLVAHRNNTELHRTPERKRPLKSA